MTFPRVFSNTFLIKTIAALGFAAAAIIAALGFAGIGYANSPDDITFPVTELGSCESERECKAYCDDFTHIKECVSFAEKHNLFSSDEAEKARHFAEADIVAGPGGCTSEEACEFYCENITHINECIAFGEEHGLIPPDELHEAKQIAAALAAGAELPGGCTSKDSCEEYCEDGAHIEECIAFAEKAGFMDEEELAEVRQILPLMKSGEMPGGCQNKRECEAYCDDEAHFDECLAFAEKAGFISSEEAEFARKTGGKGPGGCVRDACEDYCEDPAHQEECFAFAKEHGLISDDELRDIEEGMTEFRRVLDDAPPEVISCLDDVLGAGTLADIRTGHGMPPRDSESGIRGCFEEFGGSMQEEGKARIHEFLESAPRPVVQCVTERAGNDIAAIERGEFRGDERGLHQVIETCFREFAPEGDFGGEGGPGEHGMPGGDMQSFINIDSIPPFARECVERKLGNNDVDPREVGHIIEGCVREFMPEDTMPMMHNEMEFEMHDEFGPEPPEFKDGFEQIQDFGDATREQFEAQFQDQFQAEFERQFEEQYQQEYERQFNEFEGQYKSLEGFQGSFPETTNEPQSQVPRASFLGNVLIIVNQLFGY